MITAEEIKALWLYGWCTAEGYLYNLFLILGGGGWVHIDNVSEFCKEWQISRKAFYRAKAKLTKKGKMSEEVFGRSRLRISPAPPLTSPEDEDYLYEEDG